MSTFNHMQSVANWQEDLAAYGLARGLAKGAVGGSIKNPEFFGFHKTSMGYEIGLAESPTDIPTNMTLSVVAPDKLESFDMLVTKDLQGALKDKDEISVRAFISRVLDEI